MLFTNRKTIFANVNFRTQSWVFSYYVNDLQGY